MLEKSKSDVLSINGEGSLLKSTGRDGEVGKSRVMLFGSLGPTLKAVNGSHEVCKKPRFINSRFVGFIG